MYRYTILVMSVLKVCTLPGALKIKLEGNILVSVIHKFRKKSQNNSTDKKT